MKLDVNGCDAFAATGGRALDARLPTIVFVHGGAMDHTVWVLPTRYFVRHGFNVLAVDLPGHGRSGGAPLATIEAMAAWVVEVLDAADIESAALVGHSMGALVTLHAAATYASRVRGLVLIGVSAPMPVSDALLSAAHANRHAGFDMVNLWGHSYAAQLGGFGTPGAWMPGGGVRLLERSAPGVLYNDLRACNAYVDGGERAAAIACPTLLILGQRDQMSPARAGRRLAAVIAGAECLVLEGAGHMLIAERPNEVLDALIAATAPLRITHAAAACTD